MDEIDPRDEIILKCAAYMFYFLVYENGPLSFDILSEKWNGMQDWRIILSTPLMPNRLYDFVKHLENDKVIVSTYTKAHSFFVEL